MVVYIVQHPLLIFMTNFLQSYSSINEEIPLTSLKVILFEKSQNICGWDLVSFKL